MHALIPTLSRTRLSRGTSLAALVVALAATTPALAQDATPPAAMAGEAAQQAPADEIVVTGIRASLQKSQALKRNSATIVEAVSAEDIGKLPDVSIADSLARLPGVTAQRLEGRDQRLSVRGLGPDFGTTLLNGREQVTVGDNRGVEYDQYPSEFFQNVVVHKAADASLATAGIAGTVDLHMLRPLEQRRTVALNGRVQLNGNKAFNPDSPRIGWRGSVTYIDKFADNTLGIALGLSATSAPTNYERYNAWGFPETKAIGGTRMLGGAKPYVQSNVLNRYGAVATVQWRPSDRFESTLDVLYSKFKETQRLRGIEFPLSPEWGSGATVSNIKTVDGLVTEATVSNIFGVMRNDYNKRTADSLSLGWNNRFAITDKLNLKVDASWSNAKRTDFLLETYTGTSYRRSGVSDTVRILAQDNGTFKIVPTLDYSNPAIFGMTDPNGWGYNGTTAVVQAGFLNKPKFEDDMKALRASLDGEFDSQTPFKGWEIGAIYSKRKKTSAFTSYFLCPKGAGTNCTVDSGTTQFAPVPAEAILKDQVSLDFLGVPRMLTVNPLYLYNNSLNAVYDNRPVSLVRDNTVSEDVATAYGMLKIDGDWYGKRISGSMGVQAVHTDQWSTGSISSFDSNTGQVTVVPAAGGDKYWRILPSVALAMELSPNLFVKTAYSRTIVRPRMDEERVNQEFKTDPGKIGSQTPGDSFFGSEGGNARLRPFLSTNFDVSFEKYFARSGYVALAGYYKLLDDYVDRNKSFIYDFAAAASQLTPEQRALLGTTLGRVKAPDNTGSGYLRGVELTLSLPFANLTDSLDGFGFFGSGSYTDSSVMLPPEPKPITIPGLSDWVANASLYYEKSGFQARTTYRYRSEYIGEVAGLSANPEYRRVKGEGILDAQIGYEFQPGSSLAGLSVMLQGKNLTDQPFVTYDNNDKRQVRDYQRFGRDFYLSLGYKF